MTKHGAHDQKRTPDDGIVTGCNSDSRVSGAMASIRGAPRLAGRALVKLYRYTFSALVGFHCRYLPTCSDYADEALARHGLWAGSWMTLARILRCHPYGTSGLDVTDVVLKMLNDRFTAKK